MCLIHRYGNREKDGLGGWKVGERLDFFVFLSHYFHYWEAALWPEIMTLCGVCVYFVILYLLTLLPAHG